MDQHGVCPRPWITIRRYNLKLFMRLHRIPLKFLSACIGVRGILGSSDGRRRSRRSATPAFLCQKARTMLARTLDSLYLRALVSPAFGRAVRAVIVLAVRDASPRREAADGGAGAMVPAR